MRLIFMRHCKSSWANAGQADHERPLNNRGRTSAAALGAWLRDKGYMPDLALVSSSRRTQETFAGLALTCPVQFDRRLYLAEPAMILRCIEEVADTAQTLLVIGHNPGFADAAWRLARTPVAHPRFGDYPTGATTVFTFDTDSWIDVSWGKGNAEDFAIPREL